MAKTTKKPSPAELLRRQKQSHQAWRENRPDLTNIPNVVANSLPTAHKGRLKCFRTA